MAVLVAVFVGVFVSTGAGTMSDTYTPPEKAELLLLLSRMFAVIKLKSGNDPGGPAVNEAFPEPSVVTWEVKIRFWPCAVLEGFTKNSRVY